MFIQTVELKNVRSFESAKLELSAQINLIVGPNNSGKSTILRAIYKIQNLQALKPEDLRISQKKGQLLLEFAELCYEEQTDFGISRENYLKFPFLYYRSDLINHNFSFVQSKLSIGNIYSGDTYESTISNFNPKEDQIHFIYPFFSKRKGAYYSSTIDKETTYTISETFSNLPAKIQKVRNNAFTCKKYDELCEDILGFIVTTIASDHEVKIGIHSNNISVIPIESMGEGVANIVGLIILLLTEEGKLFLIEELENDIHPATLKKLLDLIINKSSSNQFIISTHSNIVLKYLGSQESSKIFYTQSEFKVHEVANKNYLLPTSTIVEIGSLTEERRTVLQKLGYDLFDFDIYEAYLILEESSAERIIREYLIPWFVPYLSARLRTIAAQGVRDVEPKFNDLNRLFLYLHLISIYQNRAWVITDGDQAGKEVVEKMQKKYMSWDSSHFTCFDQSDFEVYYPKNFSDEFDTIKEKSKDQKRVAKDELLKKLINWINEDRDRAKNAFIVSAKEVIQKLQMIQDKMKAGYKS